jgi:hypothetical protein
MGPHSTAKVIDSSDPEYPGPLVLITCRCGAQATVADRDQAYAWWKTHRWNVPDGWDA